MGSVTGVIISLSTIFCNAFSITSLASIGTFLLACCTGCFGVSTLIVYCPGMSPVVSKLLGNAFSKAIMSLTLSVVIWSCET